MNPISNVLTGFTLCLSNDLTLYTYLVDTDSPSSFLLTKQETSAAIKLQAAYRRLKAMKEMEERGVNTKEFRKKNRRRRARGTGDSSGSDDMSSLFNCCGVGLALGGEDDYDYEEIRMHEKTLYEERKKTREQREAQLRSSYRRKQCVHQAQGSPSAAEAFEVLE